MDNVTRYSFVEKADPVYGDWVLYSDYVEDMNALAMRLDAAEFQIEYLQNELNNQSE